MMFAEDLQVPPNPALGLIMHFDSCVHNGPHIVNGGQSLCQSHAQAISFQVSSNTSIPHSLVCSQEEPRSSRLTRQDCSGASRRDGEVSCNHASRCERGGALYLVVHDMIFAAIDVMEAMADMCDRWDISTLDASNMIKCLQQLAMLADGHRHCWMASEGTEDVATYCHGTRQVTSWLTEMGQVSSVLASQTRDSSVSSLNGRRVMDRPRSSGRVQRP